MPRTTPVIAKCLTTGQTYQYRSVSEAARDGGFEKSCIYYCLHGKQESHGGYTFTPLTPVNYTPRGRVLEVGQLRNEGMTIAEVCHRLNLKAATVKHLSSHAKALGLF